jgi:hypothetical protein
MRTTLVYVGLALIFITWFVIIINRGQTNQKEINSITAGVNMTGLPDDATIEETLTNNWQIVRIKGSRFKYLYVFNSKTKTFSSFRKS